MDYTLTELVVYNARRARCWASMFMGKSYYHQIQGLGKVFEPGKLKGYFSDLTAKTRWNGDVDGSGVPYNVFYGGAKLYFPTMIMHMALGYWDYWLLNRQTKDKERFLSLCKWVLDNQDEKGGLDTWSVVKNEKFHRYSAMVQGEALSVLSRAFVLTNENRYAQAASKALDLFQIPVEKGGVSYFEDAEIFLEEYPCEPRNTILNGWIFAIFGLYDYLLVFENNGVKEIFSKTVATLAKNINIYDSGYWTYYDCQKNLASPMYHTLHINQLEALCMISDERIFKEYYMQWRGYRGKFLNKSRALVLKGIQKLKEPPRQTFAK
jgi:heparosan-N-sulfate-glucuronate 5-epimerase